MKLEVIGEKCDKLIVGPWYEGPTEGRKHGSKSQAIRHPHYCVCLQSLKTRIFDRDTEPSHGQGLLTLGKLQNKIYDLRVCYATSIIIVIKGQPKSEIKQMKPRDSNLLKAKA